MTATVLLSATTAAGAQSDKVHPVRTARQAVEVAVSHEPRNSPDSDPKNWDATFDAKSKTWRACAGRPKSSPQSGYCKSVDAKTGRIVGMEIIN